MLEANARFDWYQATVYVETPEQGGLLDALMAAWDLVDLVPGKGMHGYLRGARIVRGDRELCQLWWGGNPGVNVTASGEDAPALAEALRRLRVPYGVTRLDACCDWVEEGLFDSLSSHLIEFATSRGIVINQQGDWIRGQARTLYLGSKSSPLRLVLYEKGYEVGGDAPREWVRLEVRVRPKGEHKHAVARWSPSDALACGWFADALKALGWDQLKGKTVGTVWRRSDAERARLALLRQYGATMEAWADEVGGWVALAAVMRAELETLKERDRRVTA